MRISDWSSDVCSSDLETRCTCRDLRTRTRACLAQKAFARARPVPGIRKLLQRPSNPVAILSRDTDVAVGPGLVAPPTRFCTAFNRPPASSHASTRLALSEHRTDKAFSSPPEHPQPP